MKEKQVGNNNGKTQIPPTDSEKNTAITWKHCTFVFKEKKNVLHKNISTIACFQYNIYRNNNNLKNISKYYRMYKHSYCISIPLPDFLLTHADCKEKKRETTGRSYFCTYKFNLKVFSKWKENTPFCKL